MSDNTIQTPALLTRLEKLREETQAKPPLGASETLWRAIEMIDLIYQLGAITVKGVIQLQGITARLAQGQETIIGKLGALGQDVGTLQQDVNTLQEDTTTLQTDLADLRGWLETRFAGVDKAVNVFQDHEH